MGRSSVTLSRLWCYAGIRQVLPGSQSRRWPEAHRRGQPLHSEALNAKNAPESAICGVLRKRSTTTGSMAWLVPISFPRSAPRRVGRTNLRTPCGCGDFSRLADRLLLILLGSAHGVVNEVSVSQQLARRDRHFLHAGNNPERANAAQAPAPLGANLRFAPFRASFSHAACPLSPTLDSSQSSVGILTFFLCQAPVS